MMMMMIMIIIIIIIIIREAKMHEITLGWRKLYV